MHARQRNKREKEEKKSTSVVYWNRVLAKKKNTNVQRRTGQRWKRVVEECKGLRKSFVCIRD